jgi:ABC-type multidrug transport system ATPase subunit
MLRRLRDSGLTILVSTPYMDEAAWCNRIALVQEGRILAIDTPEALTAGFPKKLFAVQAKDKYKVINDLRHMEPGVNAYAFGETAHLATAANNLNVDKLTQYLQQLGHTDVHVEPIPATVEDCFIDLMESGLGERTLVR